MVFNIVVRSLSGDAEVFLSLCSSSKAYVQLFTSGDFIYVFKIPNFVMIISLPMMCKYHKVFDT